MDNENDYVDYFYDKYEGRVAIGVGYTNEFSEIFPLVFQNGDGESIGIVALGAIASDQDVVHIFHLSAFVAQCGDGSEMLGELCRQADIFRVYLSVSAIFMDNGKDSKMAAGVLEKWYERFDFVDNSGYVRAPQ
jgi:hypothetical protein